MSLSAHETRFDRPGTLRRPGPIGRIVRLLLGIWLLVVCWSYLGYPGMFVRATPPWEVLIGIAFALWLIPPIVNIGWGTNWKAWPRYASWGVLIAWAVANGLLTGSLWSPGLGRFARILCLYAFGHLGLSFVLAAAIATPGCEMRAIPHLWTLLTGKATKEHFCPGFLNGLDAWERRRKTGST
ncbi:MAG: hypothetical protein ACE5GX_06500 [Thermoanaerobaculia bacterium]